MERETFDVVWAMSEPGSGAAEGCLKRCTNYEYLVEDRKLSEDQEHPSAFMPDVSPTTTKCFRISY